MADVLLCVRCGENRSNPCCDGWSDTVAFVHHFSQPLETKPFLTTPAKAWMVAELRGQPAPAVIDTLVAYSEVIYANGDGHAVALGRARDPSDRSGDSA